MSSGPGVTGRYRWRVADPGNRTVHVANTIAYIRFHVETSTPRNRPRPARTPPPADRLNEADVRPTPAPPSGPLLIKGLVPPMPACPGTDPLITVDGPLSDPGSRVED